MDLLKTISEAGITSLLFSITQLCMVFVTVCLVSISMYTKKTTAFTVVVALSLVMSILHQFAEVKMLSLIGTDEVMTSIIRHTWYWFFAITDLIYVVLAVFICRKWGLSKDWFSSYFLMCYVVLVGIQIARWTDRFVLNTDILGTFYSTIIPMLNLSTVIVAVIALITVLLNIKKQRM